MTKQELNDKLREYAERVIDPPAFDRGEEIAPWQDIPEISKGQLCIVLKQTDQGLIEFMTINNDGHVFVCVAEAWQFDHYQEPCLRLVG